MLIFTKYLKEMTEAEAKIRLNNDNISSLYKVVLFNANIRTYEQFLALNKEYELAENCEYFFEKQRFMEQDLIESYQLSRTFKDFVGRDVYLCELDYFANCNAMLQRV